ncbi:MAG TPA: ATP synthase subunit I [Geobacteraceae bacterium]
MVATTSSDDNLLTILIRGSWLLLALFAVIGAVAVSTTFALSLLAGGILAIGNFAWLRRSLERLLSQQLQPDTASRVAQFRHLIRLALLGIIIYLLVVPGKADVIGLLLGLSVVIVAIIIVTVYWTLTHKGG